MIQSLKLGKWFGVNVELHFTFLLLVLGIIVLLLIFSPANLAMTLLLLFLLFASVFVHEMFHSVVANKLGYKVKKIILHPLGGLSMTEDLPTNPKHEFIIAVVGGLFNFAVVLLVYFLRIIFPQIIVFPSLALFLEKPDFVLLNFPWFALFYINFILGAFNLFTPALPLDGGRVLRSLLAFKLGFEKATRVVTRVSTIVAIILFFIGFLANSIVLLIISLFVYFGSSWEYQAVMTKQILSRVSFEKIITKKFTAVQGTKTLKQAFDLMKEKNTPVLPVKLGRQAFGFIAVDRVSGIPKKDWQTTRIERIAIKLPFIPVNAKTDEVFIKMMAKDIPFLPVKKQGKFIGLIYFRDLQKLFELEKTETEAK